MMGTISKIFKNIGYLNFRTIYVNLKYLPIKQAVYLPIFASRKVRNYLGRLIINEK